MDLFSAAELMELLLMEQSEINSQFEYWLTISFAVVVASFVAGSRLRHNLRWAVAILYILGVTTFASRWYYAAIEGSLFVTELQELGVPVNIPWVTLGSRASLMLLGTIAVVVFLVKEQFYKGTTDDD